MPLRVGTAPLGVASTSHGVGSSRSGPGSMPPYTGIDAPPGQADPTKCGVVLTPTGIDAPNYQDDPGQTRGRPFSSGVDAAERPKHSSETAIDPSQRPLDAMRSPPASRRNQGGVPFRADWRILRVVDPTRSPSENQGISGELDLTPVRGPNAEERRYAHRLCGHADC
jgi:hypothetical protein